MPQQMNSFHAFIAQPFIEDPKYAVHYHKDSNHAGVALHHHDFYEIYYFISGSVSYVVESQQYQLQPGDILLISPSELHQPLISPGPKPYERIVLWISRPFMADLSTPQSDLSLCFNSGRHEYSNLIRESSKTAQSVENLLIALLEEGQNERFGRDLLGRAKVLDLLILLNRLSKSGQYEEKAQNKDHHLVKKIVDYINQHCCEDLTLEELSNVFFINKFHLSHQFSAYVGTSPYRYILQKRLVLAKELLYKGEKAKDVARQCGFNDYANFFRAFRSEYGITPSQYIKDASSRLFHELQSGLKEAAPSVD